MSRMPPFLELRHPESPGMKVIVRPARLRRLGIIRSEFATARETRHVYRDAKRRAAPMKPKRILRVLRVARWFYVIIAVVALINFAITLFPSAIITGLIFSFLTVISFLPCSKTGHDGFELGAGSQQCHRCRQIFAAQYYREL